ncbi:MAG TPA: CoA transferase [Candidatus Lustribacter sp.]|nr:CoA transferase [Candidatus Lustribacter sp.]
MAPEVNARRLPACLDGIRVLELGSTIAGPSATRHLADLGATVWKVEPPGGDQLRTWGTLAPDGTSYWFKSHNRGKRLLAFDLRREADAAAVRRLALDVDIIVENFRPGWLATYGLDAASLRGEKPALIYLSISGYGQDGPMSAQPGYGAIAESMGGFRHLTGEPDGPPMRMGISIADELAGLNAALAAVAALHARDRDGVGETIDISLVESAFSMLESALSEYVHAGKVTNRSGNRLTTAAPSNVYATADERWIAIAGNGEGIFRRLAAAMGQPELANDPRFENNAVRVANMAVLDDEIARWTQTLSLAELERVLAQAGVPAGPILAIDAIVAHPHMQARQTVRTIHDERGTEVATYGPVPHLSERPIEFAAAAGAVGRDQELLSP